MQADKFSEAVDLHTIYENGRYPIRESPSQSFPLLALVASYRVNYGHVPPVGRPEVYFHLLSAFVHSRASHLAGFALKCTLTVATRNSTAHTFS